MKNKLTIFQILDSCHCLYLHKQINLGRLWRQRQGNLSLFNQIEVKEAVKTNTKSGQESSIHNKDLSFSEMGKKMLYILEGCSYTRPKDSGRAIKNYLYEDKNGNCTFGAGILLHNGGACTANDIIEWGDKSWADVESTLENELSDFIREVHTAIDNMKDFTITQTEFDAMVIFCYNIGQGGFKRSDFVKALKGKIRDGSLIFNYASKPGTNPVYQKRRFVEQTLFETGNYTWDGTKAITADTKIPCKK